MNKIPKYNWLPGLLLIYLIGMTAWFGADLVRNGETLRLIVVFILELLVIFILRIFLKKRAGKS